MRNIIKKINEAKDQPRILVLSNMYPSKEALTYGIFVKNQVESLRKRNFNVDVIAIDDPRMGKRHAAIKYGRWMVKSLVNILLRGRKYDIIHAHYVFPTGVIGLIYKKLLKKTLFVTAHGGDIDRMARLSPMTSKWTRQILNEADQVIAVGNQLKEDIVNDFSVADDKVSILNMGVDRNVFYPIKKTEAKKNLGLDTQCFHILFVGNLIKAKGLEELAVAFSRVALQFSNVHLHLIGQKKDDVFYHQLLTLFDDKIIDRVHFEGVKPQKELALWMNAANLFVLPSHIEGFGLVALEAMSCRTPVVGTEVGGLKYLLDGDCGFLVPPKSINELVKTIISCIEDRVHLEHHVDKAEERAEANSEEKMMTSLCSLYKKYL